jgi:hypothetical protein
LLRRSRVEREVIMNVMTMVMMMMMMMNQTKLLKKCLQLLGEGYLIKMQCD